MMFLIVCCCVVCFLIFFRLSFTCFLCCFLIYCFSFLFSLFFPRSSSVFFRWPLFLLNLLPFLSFIVVVFFFLLLFLFLCFLSIPLFIPLPLRPSLPCSDSSLFLILILILSIFFSPFYHIFQSTCDHCYYFCLFLRTCPFLSFPPYSPTLLFTSFQNSLMLIHPQHS